MGWGGQIAYSEGIHMKKWKIAAAAVCVCFLLTAAYAANTGAGGQNDPLVTLSYLSGTYTNQVKTMVDQAVNERKAEMEQSLNNILAGQGGTGTSTGAGSVFTVVTLTQGQTLVGDVGCEVMLRIGTAVCSSSDSVGLIDTTAGSVLGNGQALVTNHLYMVTISTRSVTATSGTVKVLARGPYSIQ